jgi:branched-chain amino acid transport system ATP-binding protein
MSLLALQDVHVSYGAVLGLRGVSLTVEPGERVALLGANGAGKTTTLRTISGLLTPTSGNIEFEGSSVKGIPAHKLVSRGIAHGPEGRALLPGMTVEENLAFGHLPVRKSGIDRTQKLREVFDRFPRLEERRHQKAGTLSGGEQQMLVVGRALMSSPKLLLFDELSLGLAPQIVNLLFEIIEQVHREGTAVIIVEQFVHMALNHTDRAYVLAKGKVALEARSADLLSDPDLVSAYLGDDSLQSA